MKVGFLNNQIDNRGTGNAIFDYAHYNEEILGNESVIITLDTQPRDQLMETRLLDRFGKIFSTNTGAYGLGLDVLYHIKSGADATPKFQDQRIRYVSHGVFECPTDGDRRAVVSYWLSGRCSVPCVPHIVSLPSHTMDIRSSLGIPKDAIVFGRHGGSDSFDISWVWESIGAILDRRDDIYFLFVNTEGIPHEIANNRHMLQAPPFSDPHDKRTFINTCDAMLHARGSGETFGISVGEFAICGKPVITYGGSHEMAHLMELPYAEKYYDKEELIDILLNFRPYEVKGYVEYSPRTVMRIFKEVFLD